MQKIIIALAGEMGSGKGAIVDYLVKRYGAEKIKFSDCLRDMIDRLHIEKSRVNISTMSLILRQGFGEDVLTRAIEADILASTAPIVVLDGVRRAEELDNLRGLHGVSFVYVDADMRTRYERIVVRGENASDAEKTYEQFLQESAMDADARIKPLRDTADYVIENNGSMEELQEKIDRLYDELCGVSGG